MTTPDFFRFLHFQKMLKHELFTYANCTFKDFILMGKDRKFKDSIERIFWDCFNGSNYFMNLLVLNGVIDLTILNRSTGLEAVKFVYSFNV